MLACCIYSVGFALYNKMAHFTEEWHPDSVPGDQHCSGADAEVTSGRGLLSVSSCIEWGLHSVLVRGLPIVLSSLVEHRL